MRLAPAAIVARTDEDHAENEFFILSDCCRRQRYQQQGDHH
jgi:hypothetical protein